MAAICYPVIVTKAEKDGILKSALSMKHATNAPILLLIKDESGLKTEAYNWKGERLPPEEHAKVLGDYLHSELSQTEQFTSIDSKKEGG